MAFDYSQKVFFVGCFCDCHNVQGGFEQPRQESVTALAKKHQCDSILSRIFYAFKIFESYFGPFIPLG